MYNYIQDSDFKYSEIAVALEDYSFNTTAKFTIPNLFTFLNRDIAVSETHQNMKSNIMNKDPLNISKYTSCNYIDLYVNVSKAYNRTCGKKGDRYAVIFVGGNINNCTIIEPLL